MKIFNVKTKENIKKNLDATINLIEKRLKEQEDWQKMWRKELLKNIETIELNEDTEITLEHVMGLMLENRDMQLKKVEDWKKDLEILKKIRKEYK